MSKRLSPRQRGGGQEAGAQAATAVTQHTPREALQDWGQTTWFHAKEQAGHKGGAGPCALAHPQKSSTAQLDHRGWA